MQSQVFPGAAMRHVPAEAAVPAADLAQPGMRVGTVTDAGPGHRAWGQLRDSCPEEGLAISGESASWPELPSPGGQAELRLWSLRGSAYVCVCVRERGEGWVHPSPYPHRGQGLCLPGRVVDASSDPNPALPSMAWLCQGRCWQQRARGAFARMVSVFSRIAVAESRGALEIH